MQQATTSNIVFNQSALSIAFPHPWKEQKINTEIFMDKFSIWETLTETALYTACLMHVKVKQQQ